jgi:uncharacterized membrane protein
MSPAQNGKYDMTSATGYAVGAMILFGIGDLIYKRGAAAGAPPHQFMMVQSWVFMPTVVLYGLFTGSLAFVVGALWGCLAGLLLLIGLYNFAYSLKSGSISVNAPIFRLSFVITAALAVVFLGEPLTPYKAVGIVLALVAVWLLQGSPAPQEVAGRHASRSSLVRVIIATAAVGAGNILYKYGLRAGASPASLIVAQAAVVVPLSTILAGGLDRGIRPSATALRFAPGAALVLALGFAAMVESLARGEASVVVPIAQMGFGATALLGFVFMGEPFTARKGMGLITALAALASLAHA